MDASSVSRDSIVAPLFEVDLTGVEALLEQASTRVPINTARTTVSFNLVTPRLPDHPHQPPPRCLPQAAWRSPLATILLASFGPCAAVAGFKAYVCRLDGDYIVKYSDIIGFNMFKFTTKTRKPFPVTTVSTGGTPGA